MNTIKKKYFLIIKLLLSLSLFLLAINFEKASNERLKVLLGIFACYFLLGILRKVLIKKRIVYIVSFIIEIILIYTIEYNSRFLINYFYHLLYILTLIDISINLKRKNSIVIGIILVTVSLIKYVFLVYYELNLSNISEMAFFTLISVFVLLILNFLQYYIEEKEIKEQLYKQLVSSHNKLKEYTKKVEELTMIEERNRITRDIHDTLGHNMTGIIMELEMISLMIDEDTDESKKMLDRCKMSAREGLIKIREIVETLRPSEKISKGVESIKELINSFNTKTNIDTAFDVKGKKIKTSTTINVILYRIVQEALTNSVRHGKATIIRIQFEYLENKIEFKIHDNGIGCKQIKKGFGLKSMQERVENVGGQISYSSDKGFCINGFLPLEVKKYD